MWQPLHLWSLDADVSSDEGGWSDKEHYQDETDEGKETKVQAVAAHRAIVLEHLGKRREGEIGGETKHSRTSSVDHNPT